MEVEVVEYIETTFEHQYLLKNKKGGDCQPVWWMCPKGNFEEDRVQKFRNIFIFRKSI